MDNIWTFSPKEVIWEEFGITERDNSLIKVLDRAIKLLPHRPVSAREILQALRSAIDEL